MKWIMKLVYLLVFIFSVALIVMGQKSIGPMGLLVMLVGLVGILALMFIYNKKYE